MAPPAPGITARNAVVFCPNHYLDQLVERGSRLPAELVLCLLRIADQGVDFGRAVKLRIDLHQHAPRLAIDADLVLGLALPLNVETQRRSGLADEFADRYGPAGRQNIIVGARLLQHGPDAGHIIAGKSPVAAGVQIAELQHAAPSVADLRQGDGALTRDKFGA